MELCKRIIDIYTRGGETALVPFVGSGCTIITAVELGRRGIGLEVNPAFLKLAENRLSDLVSFGAHPEVELNCHDTGNLPEVLKPESIDLVVTSPPYWNIH